MTSCSQNRHATRLRHISKLLKEVGFEPTLVNPTDLQSATLNRSVILSHIFNNYRSTIRLVLRLIRFNFFGRHPLCGDKL